MLCCVSFGLVGLIQVSPVSKIQVIFYSTAPIVSWINMMSLITAIKKVIAYKYISVNKNKNIFEIKMKNPDSGPIRESLGAFLILAVGLLNFRTGNEACNINYIQLNKRYNFICFLLNQSTAFVKYFQSTKWEQSPESFPTSPHFPLGIQYSSWIYPTPILRRSQQLFWKIMLHQRHN